MKFGEIVKGFFGKKAVQETDDQIRTRMAGIEQNIANIKAFQNATDSSSSTITADATRLQYLNERLAELKAKLQPPTTSEVKPPIPLQPSGVVPQPTGQEASVEKEEKAA